MIQDSQLPELRQYRALERRLLVRACPAVGSLVVGGGNDERPIHGWFKFKESYDAGLLPTLLSHFPSSAGGLRILDPFCGVGTTILAAQKLDVPGTSALGIEHNPFIRFVAEAKVTWHLVDPKRLLELGEDVVDAPPSSIAQLPELSSITSGRCISTHVARRIVGIREAIAKDGDSPMHNLLLLGLASATERLSKTRKDGRALRIVDRPRQVVSSIVRQHWKRMASDIVEMTELQGRRNSVNVVSGDGLTCPPSLVQG
jgi:hypothetical protein